MPIRKGHAAVTYRRENGQDILYSQSLVFSCYVPLFVKFSYIFPQLVVLDKESQEIKGVFNVSRFMFEHQAEHIIHPETHQHLSTVIAGYVLPFTRDEYNVPVMLGTGIYNTKVRFWTSRNGVKRSYVAVHTDDYIPMYMRYSFNQRLQSYTSKYYNQKWLYPLFTGVLPKEIYVEDTTLMFK